MVYYCHKCKQCFESYKHEIFHKKYECLKDMTIKKRYDPNKCNKCNNYYTTQKKLLKHLHTHKTYSNNDILKLSKLMIGDIWNIVFGYVCKRKVNTSNMWYHNDYDMLNCLYIQNNFAFNKIQNEMSHTIIKLLQYNRTKIVKLWIKYTNNYIPSKFEYNSLIKSNITKSFINKIALKNIGKNIEIYKYIVEDCILKELVHPGYADTDHIDTIVQMGDKSVLKTIIKNNIYKGELPNVKKTKLNLYLENLLNEL
jgi:hypothetical protein